MQFYFLSILIFISNIHIIVHINAMCLSFIFDFQRRYYHGHRHFLYMYRFYMAEILSIQRNTIQSIFTCKYILGNFLSSAGNLSPEKL